VNMPRKKKATAKSPADAKPATFAALLSAVDPTAAKGAAHLKWPPDTFAICAYLLHQSGAYKDVLAQWPPVCGMFCKVKQPWPNWVERVGKAWRKAGTTLSVPPKEVKDAWKQVKQHLGLEVQAQSDSETEKQSRSELHCALIALVAMADAASAGVGLPSKATRTGQDMYLWRAAVRLGSKGGSLASNVALQVARVLPKLHTPNVGITLRSLTHHLALHVGNDVVPVWREVPWGSDTDSILNILVAPWPTKLHPSDFKPVRLSKALQKRASYARVNFERKSDPDGLANWTRERLEEAERVAEKVHGLVFPEASLTPTEFDRLKEVVSSRDVFVVAGVAVPPTTPAGLAQNRVRLLVTRHGSRTVIDQGKHHRWKLTRSQVEMYGLAVSLHPHEDWWENIEIPQREVHFAAFNNGTTICCLICEDLARMDPVSSLVRSVGPNLLIALLMDGPQLGVRWPARYATVLAEDPGCSVLTVSSLGMVDMVQPRKGQAKSRSVALWKDNGPGMVEIELPKDKDAVLLTLYNETVEEFSADGRSDGKMTDHPRLEAVHFLGKA